MLGMFKQKLQESMNKVAGNTDFLEAVCAGCALVAAADGDISDSEIDQTSKAIASNPTLAGAFSRTQIEKTADQMLRRAQAGRSGRMGLYKEIDDIAAQDEARETVFLAALDVAEADGNIDESEQAVLDKIAERLSLNPKDYNV